MSFDLGPVRSYRFAYRWRYGAASLVAAAALAGAYSVTTASMGDLAAEPASASVSDAGPDHLESTLEVVDAALTGMKSDRLGGVVVDHEEGTVRVLATSEGAAEAQGRVEGLDNVQVAVVDHSADSLSTAAAAIQEQSPALASEGIEVEDAEVRPSANAVEVRLASPESMKAQLALQEIAGTVPVSLAGTEVVGGLLR